MVGPIGLETRGTPGYCAAWNRMSCWLFRGWGGVAAGGEGGGVNKANYALDEGRDVFAVPGSIADPLSAGCHRLVQQGAKLIHSSNDILSEYGQQTSLAVAQTMKVVVVPDKQFSGIASKHQTADAKTPSQATQHPLVDLCKTPRSLDDLLTASHMDYAQLTTTLFELQVAGVMRQDFVGMWHAVDR